MNILILSPHPDDAELMVGGSIAKWKRLGHFVKVIAFSLCDNPRIEREFNGSMGVLGVNQYTLHDFPRRVFSLHRQEILELLRLEEDIDLVVMPSGEDKHQDHRVIHEEGLRAFNCSIWMYCAEHNSNITVRRCVSELLPSDFHKKVMALEQYKSQYHRPYFMEFIEDEKEQAEEYFDIYRQIDRSW